jgi:hypothetical protein
LGDKEQTGRGMLVAGRSKKAGSMVRKCIKESRGRFLRKNIVPKGRALFGLYGSISRSISVWKYFESAFRFPLA